MTTKQTVQPQEKDLLLSFLSSIINYVKVHKKAVLTAVVILVLAGVIGYAYAAHVRSVEENSWAAYYKAQLAVMQNPQEVTALDSVAQQFPNTSAAQYAQLLKGDLLYAGENYAQAADVYAPLLNSSNEILRTDAVLSLGAARQASQDYAGSISVLQDFIANNPKSFALPQAYFTLAMSQELAGQKQAAQETYQQILGSYPSSYFGKVAKDKLAVLSK